MKKFFSIVLSLLFILSSVSLVNIVFAENDTIYDRGDIVSFGSYPQSKVTDKEIVSQLNLLVPDYDKWISYGYCSGTGSMGSMVLGDWMRYIDVEYNGEKYRGIKFTKNRPNRTYYQSGATSQQTYNGYKTDIVYWFIFEEIRWQILDVENGLVMCKDIIDSQPYSNTIYYYNEQIDDWTYAYFNDESNTTFASNYKTSYVRNWLNNDFYSTAFSEAEKQIIGIAKLNNDCIYTLCDITGYEKLNSEETNDKVFLLSYSDVCNVDYGFKSDENGKFDENLCATGTDYAKSQGLLVYDYQPLEQYIGNSHWFLRTPGTGAGSCCYVYADGSYGSGQVNVAETTVGIRPAIKLNSYDFPEEPTVTPPTTEPEEPSEDIDIACTCNCHKEDGFIRFIWSIVRFFWKLFRINPICDCGIAHY